MDLFWINVEELLHLFFPTDFTLFQMLLIIGTCFGVVVWFLNKLKGD